MTTESIIRTTKLPADIDRRFWGTTDRLKTFAYPGTGKRIPLKGVYTFFIIDLATDEIVESKGLDPGGRTNLAQYQFPVAPQSIEMSEPSSTQIVATQNGGKFIESHGSLFKDLRIQGTVGFRPNPVTNEIVPGLKSATGIDLTYPSTIRGLFTNDNRGLHPDEYTGFDDIIFLRNLFRKYWDTKNNPALARRHVLVWISAKESEAWVVEPINFTTTRDSGSPLTYNYAIQCRSLYPYDLTFKREENKLSGVLGQVKSIRDVLQTVNKVIRDIADAFNQIAGIINYAVNLPLNIVNTVLTPALEVISSAAAIKNSLTGIGQLYEGRVKQWATQCKSAIELLSESASGGSDNVAAASDFVQDSAGQDGVDGILRKSIRDMLRSSQQFLSLDFLWTQPRQKQVTDYTKAYNDNRGEPPLTQGSPLNTANLRIPDTVEEKLSMNESIRSAAKRFLGDESYWKLLVMINDLKAPYISASGGQNVLQPGDPILVPAGTTPGDDLSEVPRAVNPDEASEALNPAYKRYGRDLKLVNSSAGSSYADFEVNGRGDLSMIEGLENVEQAIMIKFSTEQGELATHPLFGAKYPLGEKFPGLQKFHEYSLNVRRTLRQDPRVKEIEKLSLAVEGATMRVDSTVNLRGADVELPISLVVRT